MTDLFVQQQHEEGASCGMSHCCGPPRGEWWEQSPERHDATADIESKLAKEMNELSFQEREQVFDEIHGVAKSQEETPEFKAKAIQQFDLAVSHLFKRKRRALDRAIFLKPSIETDAKFNLLFLRADSYDAAKAANRMSRYFEQKLVLFGEDKLVKDITQDDVTAYELELGDKMIGTFSQRDRSGRPVRVGLPNKIDYPSAPLECLLRGAWYHTMAIVDDDEAASTKGLCQISYNPGSVFKPEHVPYRVRLGWKAGDVMACLPARISSFHYCYDNPAVKLAIGAITQGLGKKIRLRTRTHFGSPVEIQYSLLTYGIDISEKVYASEGSFVIDKAWLDRRKQAEDRQEQRRLDDEAITGIVLYPNPKDVLIGRGHFYASHSGNRRYHALVESNLDVYNQCNNRFQKTAISREIVKTIRDSSGRFLSRTKGGWEIMDDSAAREKTAIAFRSFKKRARS